jgi:hypothetical protein
MTSIRYLFATLFLAWLASSCGNTDPGDQGDTNGGDGDASPDDTSRSDSSEDYYPMKVGNFWKYLETETETSIENTLTYEVTETTTDTFGSLGEKEVFVIENIVIDDDNLDDDEKRVQYVIDNGTRAERLRHYVYVFNTLTMKLELTKERNYEPGFLRFDRSRVAFEEAWTETLTRFSDSKDTSGVEEKVMVYELEVLAVDELVEVSAGTFNCIKIKRLSGPEYDNETKYYWFAKGVGKVREADDTSIEELLEYRVE